MSASGSAQTKPDFSLAQVAADFPSQGFEDRIEFWIKVFARNEMNEVMFHDSNDLGLVYEVERIGASTRLTPAEEERQRELIGDRREEYEKLFEGIARLGADSPRLNPLQRQIVQALRDKGHATGAAELRRRADTVRAQRGIRSKFLDGLRRSGRYLDHIEETFEAEGLPVELAVLPHVESSFDYNAYSRAAAAGIWQFTRGTGRSYLRINSVVDERLDPIRATEAAARVLKENYRTLGSWPLAITAYNYGKYGMARARSRYGDDLLRIIDKHKTRTFGFASKNFYAEFLAALEVTHNSSRYFGEFEMEPEMRYDTVRIAKTVDPLHLTAGGSIELAQLVDYNPHLRTLRGTRPRPIPAGVRLRVPEGLGGELETAVRNAPASREGVSVGADGSIFYRVQRGDTLGRIAARFGTSSRRLQQINGLRSANRIYPGQNLLVGADAGARTRSGSPARSRSASATASYRVRRGDTLSSIATRFGTTTRRLQGANSLSNPHRLHVGQRLVVPAGGDSGATLYRIRRGDTLTHIARRFNTSVQDLKRANSISNANRIQPGQRLLIPQSSRQ